MIVSAPAAGERGNFIGRNSDLERLVDARRDAGRGRGRIVLIGGEAGIGKSRLLHAFGGIADARALRVSVRCIEFVQQPLAPLQRILAGLVGSGRARGPQDEADRRLIERLRFEQRAESPGYAPGELFDAVDAVFARFSERRTLVLFIDDLHWADRSTLGFLDHTAERIARRRVLVVAAYRTEEVDAAGGRLASFAGLLSHGNVSTVALAPLNDEDARVLIGSVDPSTPPLRPAVVEDIVRRGQGNPFFLEELVKSTRERRTDDAVSLPPSVRAAVLARAGRMTEPERGILSFAAVLGERFSVERLAAVANEPRETVVAAMERARALSLVVEGPAARELSFRHALTQEVLYGELLKERVRPIHEAIGRELEARSQRDGVLVELAHHWWCAGDAERSARYCEAAGDRAVALGATADAVVYYERALRRTRGDDAVHARLEHKAGNALRALGHPVLAGAHFDRARRLYLTAGDFAGFVANALVQGANTYNTGDVNAAIDRFRDALERATGRVPESLLDRLRARIAFSSLAALDFGAAAAWVAAVREPAGDAVAAALLGQTRSRCFASAGNIKAWRATLEPLLQAAERVGDGGDTLRWAHVQIALDAIGLGDRRTARRNLEDAAATFGGRPRSSDAVVLAVSSLERTLAGEYESARWALERTRVLPGEEYTTGIHVRLAALALGICAGDDALLAWDDAEPFLGRGRLGGMNLAAGLLAGPVAYARGLFGLVDDARRALRGLESILTRPHRFPFAFLAAARYGDTAQVSRLRSTLGAAVAEGESPVDRALLDIFDACAAEAGSLVADARSCGLRAADAFGDIGWPWFAALALEVAGESERALSAYRRMGGLRDVRRLEAPAERDPLAALSSRECEVARCVARAETNDEIARSLGISRRTVEKHVSTVLGKLGLRSRNQLGLLLAADFQRRTRSGDDSAAGNAYATGSPDRVVAT